MPDSTRAMEIATPLGSDVLLFHRMHAREELSRLSEYSLELLSEVPDIDMDDILGMSVTIRLNLPDDSPRFFNGYVTRFSQQGMLGRYHRYVATVRPWLWFLTRTTDCRIFQDMAVPDIVKTVFRDHDDVADFVYETTSSYRKWVYCVQYRETDFNFISRLLEHEGIYYYFRHTDGHDTLVLTDSSSKHQPFPGCEKLPLIPPAQLVRPDVDHVSRWDFAREVQPGGYVHDDYDLERPRVEIKTKKVVRRSHPHSDYEIYDYPGHYLQKADGEQYAAVRIDEYGSRFETASGETNARGLSVGSLLTLSGCPRADQNREHLVLSATWDMEYSEYEALPTPGGSTYSCSFVAMPSQQQFRPQRLTPKPFVQGPQTAMVVGPAGDEIYTDDYGRVKVQFHWDRYGNQDENSSCWIRVSQPWAGKGWGSVSTPRIGQEVVVDFLEGDPDQPIITGRVYNADCQPPFGFPAGAVTSGIKSATHKGQGYNEMSMDDTAGKEKVTIHGQYDMNTTVGNNQTNDVGVDQSNKVGSNQKEEIGVNRELSIGTNDTVSVGANRSTTIGGNEELSVSGSRQVSVAGKEDVTISGKSGLQVGGSRTETIAGSHAIVNPRMTVTTATQLTMAAGSNFTGTSAKVNLLAGSKFLANSGGKMDVKAGAALTQQSGAAMNVKSGAGMNVQSSAAMNLKSGAAMKTQAGGAMNLKAGGPINGKGSVIKLNSPTNIKGTTLTVK